ncbi:DgyrCDS10838 [Dimorphilus gyrociliatus]|uniref:DgyrCDS10838 n=1 Tax=Dimorphilus gyrociliatus TaxID=2664684 RepID=A0A7I8W3F5_9ANNE|nr:DgyrCDS10838 [Dimorphilus gyrociliatus]
MIILDPISNIVIFHLFPVGYGKNRAIKASTGKFLCFLDIDDTMEPSRITKQLQLAKNYPDSLIGCQFRREPENSTQRYTKWANRLNEHQLNIQIYTSHGPTIIMPTWFCSRQVWSKVGGFDESGKGCPEDLLFFYQHIRLKGLIKRVDEILLNYIYHPSATTFSIDKETIWKYRVSFLEERVLRFWESFTIWNAGKQGRKLYRSLSKENKKKVIALCDVDKKKIDKFSYNSQEGPIPVIHFSKAESPFVICVKLDLTNGSFERNLESLNLKENIDYVHFN